MRCPLSVQRPGRCSFPVPLPSPRPLHSPGSVPKATVPTRAVPATSPPWALLACPRWPRCSLRSPHLHPCSLRWAPVLPPCTYPGPSCYTSQPCWRPASTGHHAPAAVARGSVSPAGSARQPLQCCPVSWAGAPDPRGRRVLCGRLQAPVLWGHRKPTALPAPGCRLLAGQSPDVSGPHHPAVCFPFSEPLVSTAAVTSPVC